jgi:hypothetical protein
VQTAAWLVLNAPVAHVRAPQTFIVRPGGKLPLKPGDNYITSSGEGLQVRQAGFGPGRRQRAARHRMALTRSRMRAAAA